MRRGATARLTGALVSTLLVALAGCGAPGGDYCSALEAGNQQIADMVGSGSPSALLSNLPLLRDLAEKAPSDLTDEWQVFIGALEALDGALDDAGVKPSDFKDGKPPAGLAAADRKLIADAAGQIGTEDVVAAVSGIEQQGRDVCKVNLGLS
ncbi:MAG: hypothetical protein JWQ15_859 [Marmoricola sp.]|nr:hypothetical protein [Marmoricola sp.]